MFPAMTSSRWPALIRFPDVRVMSMFASLFGCFPGLRNLHHSPYAQRYVISREGWARLISALEHYPSQAGAGREFVAGAV